MKALQPPLKIALITTVDRNPGDAFIRAGIEYLIQQLIPYYEPLYVDKHDYHYHQNKNGITQRFLDKLRLPDHFSRQARPNQVRDADLVIQAGAPFYYIVPNQDGRYDKASSSITTNWIAEVWLKELLAGATPPVLNLALGTCQPFTSDASEFHRNEALIEFIRRTVERSILTTVRERVAARLLESCGLPANCLPCTAVFAADQYRIFPSAGEFICMNYMHGSAHYSLAQNIDFKAWERTFLSLYSDLNSRYPVVVMCHSPSEVLLTRKLIPSADTFFSTDYVEYLRMYAKARFGVLNRVHGAIALAGLGRPSVIIGNDTRALMGELLELPTYFVDDARPDKLLDHCSDFDQNSETWSGRLHDIKETSRTRYLQLLTASIGNLIERASGGSGYQRSDSDKLRKMR